MLNDFLPELEVAEVNRRDEVLQFICHGKQSCALCPYCTKISHCVHSRYIRILHDERVFGYDLQLRIQARRFFCDEPSCPSSIFRERFSSLCRPHSCTIICDLETPRLIAFLPFRDVKTVCVWIRSYPTTQVVARDGSIKFREVIRLADETIQQIE